MSADPTKNMVAFLLRRGEGEHVIADAPTRDEDCIRQAWEAVERRHQARPEEVVALHSEWEPAEVDAQFVAKLFPDAQLTHNFARPGHGGWEQVFSAARQAMEQAHEKQLAEEMAGRIEQVKEDGELLPILWSASSPNAPLTLPSLPHRALVPGRLVVALATVAPTPRGTIGMSHLTHDVHRRIGEPPFDALLEEASAALSRGLRIDARRSDKGDLLTMYREGSLAASAVALPDFYQRMSALLSSDRLIVGLPCPDDLVVAGVDSGWAEDIGEMVLSSPYPTTELVPSVLLIDRTGIQLIAERS
jgi:hypothetical protein